MEKKHPPQEQRPPNQLASNNMMVDEFPPYCRPCEEFHEESTCPKFYYIMEQEQMEMNNFVGCPRYSDYMNVVIDLIWVIGCQVLKFPSQ